MDGKWIVQMAERLAEKGDKDALRLLVRQASLPLLAEGMLGWTTRDTVESCLERAIPLGIQRLLQVGPALGAEVPVDLAEETVLSFPWHLERMENALSQIAHEPWQYDPRNHTAQRYLPLGVVCFCNGLHSGAVGILKRQGRLKAREVDLGPLYQAGLRIEWRQSGPFALLGNKAEPIPSKSHAILLALGEVLHRHGIYL